MPEHNCRNFVFLTANLVQKEKTIRDRCLLGRHICEVYYYLVEFFALQSSQKSPVVDGDVSLEVELLVTELDHRKSSSAERLNFVNTWNALPQNNSDQLQNFSRRGSGQVNVRQNGVFRTAIL